MKIILTVTNDLNFDQRMQRIARTLTEAGHEVTLVGRELPQSKPLLAEPFRQHRIRCRFNTGFLFYAEFNLRLFFFLLFIPLDAVGTVDLDTLAAGGLASFLRRKKRVFDAHEYFTEVPEVVHRPFVKAFWALIARLFLPLYRHAYTVGPALADIFTRKFGIPFAVVRNVPVRRDASLPPPQVNPKIILYQGALNEGRGIEYMLEAVAGLPDTELWLAGEGDLSLQLREMAATHGNKVRFWGFVPPSELPAITQQAWIGINLLENRGLSYYYSLANKFFDYVQDQKPIITMDFPEYRALNSEFEVAILLPGLSVENIQKAVLRLQNEPGMYDKLSGNCRKASIEWTWDKEKETLLAVWSDALR